MLLGFMLPSLTIQRAQASHEAGFPKIFCLWRARQKAYATA
jgi:hypothetical protein